MCQTQFRVVMFSSRSSTAVLEILREWGKEVQKTAEHLVGSFENSAYFALPRTVSWTQQAAKSLQHPVWKQHKQQSNGPSIAAVTVWLVSISPCEPVCVFVCYDAIIFLETPAVGTSWKDFFCTLVECLHVILQWRDHFLCNSEI